MYGATWDNGVDLVAVERAALCRGVCPDLNEDEQRRAVRVMTEAGKSAGVIAGRLGMSDRTVARWRDEMGHSS
ncbi:helix-turn-helix domain-containing protein [Streptomyces sp. A5-4]|uniref:helix-turn-helix domain-containing protein n=1 Tax=Streptomyces sp. A5-4 TaxID=3384771 RepID=UPI003DA96E89